MVPLAGHVGAVGAERVPEGGRPEEWEDVAALAGQRGVTSGAGCTRLRRRAGDRVPWLRGADGAGRAGVAGVIDGRAGKPVPRAPPGVVGRGRRGGRGSRRPGTARAFAVATPTTRPRPAGEPAVLGDETYPEADHGRLEAERGPADDVELVWAERPSSVPQSASGIWKFAGHGDRLAEHRRDR